MCLFAVSNALASSCPASSFVRVGLLVLAPSLVSSSCLGSSFLVNVKVKLISCGLRSKSSQVFTFHVNVKWSKYMVKVKISLTHTDEQVSVKVKAKAQVYLHSFALLLKKKYLNDGLQSPIQKKCHTHHTKNPMSNAKTWGWFHHHTRISGCS